MKISKSYILHSIFFLHIVFGVSTIRGFAQSTLSAPFKLVNSPYDEQNPVITPDGKALYFTIANHPQNTNGKKDLGDIWISLWIGGAWSAPVHAGSVINDASYNSVGGFSADGNQLFLLNHFGRNGNTPSTQGFSISRRTDSGWSTPENISIPYFLNRSAMLTGMLNEEGNVFVFSADSYNTRGVEDIYVSLKRDGQWTEPINLGSVINSSYQELSPSLSADGKTLYFASNGRKGYGGYDIYASTRLDDGWNAWTTPLNMERPLNTEARELFYRPAKRLNLFTTTRNSDGYGDIRALMDSVQQHQADTLIKILEVRHDLNSETNKWVVISGTVANSKTGAGLKSKISFKSDSLYSTTSSADGKFKLTIPSTKIYNIEVQAANFVNLAERLDIHTFELKTLEMGFKLQPIEVGALVNLKNILFYMGTTSLLEESYPELDVIVDFLKNNTKVEIELNGHTDNRGDAKKNLILSQQRVEKIKSYLVSKGISSRRIKGKGFGGNKPIAANDSEEARKLNRRVEFIIMKN
jgi:outer membrane protein OmpA-like peptidoglycan-associated protein